MAEKIKGLTYGLVTTVVGLEIHQALTREDPLGRLAADVSKWVFDTREDGLRRALIELGWTPPVTEVVRAVPAPIARPDKLEICKHSGSVTYFPMSESYKCDTCGEPLTKAEVQKLPASPLRWFPYG